MSRSDAKRRLRRILPVMIAILALACPGRPARGNPPRPGERLVHLNGESLDVTWDMMTRTPRTITAVGSDLLEVKNIASLSRREINEIGGVLAGKYAALLNVWPDQLVLKKAEKTEGSWYVSYQQAVRGIGVYGSSLGFSIGPDGRIKSLGALLYPDAQVPAAPGIQRGKALKIALESLADPDKSGYRVLSENLAIYPVRKAASIDYRRVHIFNIFPRKATHPASAADGWAVFVDTRTGEIVHHEAVLKPLGCCLPGGQVSDGIGK